MLYIKSFCFNPFQQNTYLLYDEAYNAFIIDPGNSNDAENEILSRFIKEKNLKLNRLLLTHAHIDHVLGNRYIYDSWGILPEVHEADLYLIQAMKKTGELYGISCEQSPEPKHYLTEGQLVKLGSYDFECIHTPGHSPGGISFFNRQNQILIAGDVLFYESIGRTDLPGGDHDTLLEAIRSKLFSLGDDVKVYSGHGPSTSIGHERKFNPFLR